MDREKILNEWHNVIYKKNNLVYLPTLKNACTFYGSICRINNFEIIKWADVDWEKHHIISFISDPVKKYFKGLMQDWFNIDSVTDKEVFYELLKYSTKTLSHHTFVGSYHSIPLTLIYGEYVNKIDWIPLLEEKDSLIYFKALCNEHGIEIIDNHPDIDQNISTEQQKQKINELSSNLADLDTNILYNIFLQGNKDLYSKVTQSFNFNGSNWKEISWIKKDTTCYNKINF